MSDNKISPPHRYPSGDRKKESEWRHAGANNIVRRIRDNWDELTSIGMNADLGTVIGKLYLFKVLTLAEASAARLYADAAGRYDRYYGYVRRNIASPAYQRGAGREDEVQKHIQNGTVTAYERRAERARKAWLRIQKRIPTPQAREILDEFCLYDREIHSSMHGDLKAVLKLIAKEFGFVELAPEVEGKARTDVVEKRLAKLVANAISGAESSLKTGGAVPDAFKLVTGAGEARDEIGIFVYGTLALHDDAVAIIQHEVRIRPHGTIPGQAEAALLKAAEAKGWKERNG